MNKDEMIKGMAKVITDLEDCEHKVCRIECAMPMGCVYHDEDENECWCQYFDNEKKGYYSCKEYAIATALYNAGYRKVGGDEIVLKQGEVDEFRKDQAEAKFLKDKIKKETAREILQELKEKQIFMLENDLFGGNAVLIQGINEIANEYGIDLGE